MASEIKVDTISEKTSAGGVTIDGLLIKDGGISGDVSLIGTTPTFTIGDAGAEDATLLFDGNAQDYHVGLDDTSDSLVIGLGSTLGTTPAITINSSQVATFAQAPVFPDGSIAVADLDIDGATDVGAAIVDADLFIMDDGAGGTNRKVTASRIKTYAGGANTPAFLAYKNSDQGSISANTPTKVTYTVEVFDTDGTYSSSRFTPGVEGKYFIHAMVYANGVDATKGPDALIRKNGADALHASQIPGAGANVPVEVSGILELDDDDYVEVYVDTGATGTVFSAGTTVIFCGFKIIT